MNVCEEAKETQFWKLDGCINCDPYRRFQKRELALHEAMASCLILGCQRFGHTILKPFIGTHEIIQYWKKHPEKHDQIRDRIYDLLKARELNPEEILGE